VDNERVLRAELRRALDEVLPPAPWLEAAVKDDLRKRRSRGSLDRGPGTSAQRRTAWPRTPMRLAASVLIFALAAAALAAFLGLRYHTPVSALAGALSINAYQAMVGEDVNRVDSSGDASSCTTLQSTCPAPGHPWGSRP